MIRPVPHTPVLVKDTRFFWDTHPLAEDTHPDKDTHVVDKDTHVERNTHRGRERDTHPAPRPNHPSVDTHLEKDTHLKWDIRRWDAPVFVDTHPLKEDAPPFVDTHPLKEDTHPDKDTHTGRDTHPGRGANRGFVLVATLWTLAAMAVLAAYIDGVASADMERAAVAKAALEREIACRSTEATLGYLLSTGRMNHRGLMLEPEQSFTDVDGIRGPDRSAGVIGVTGQTYAGLGGTRFSLQDENGLVSVNFPRTAQFAAALSYAGIAPADIDRIVPRADDYIDTDDDLSLSGAERFDYDKAAAPDPVAARPSRTGATAPVWDQAPGTAATWDLSLAAESRSGVAASGVGLPNPSNWSMATPLELKRVLGVDGIIAPDQWRRLLPMLTIRQTYGYNFNTMRPEVLAAVLDLEQDAVNSIVNARAERSVARLNLIHMLTGTHVDIDPAALEWLPSSLVRISIWHNAGGLRSFAGMALTPFGDAPWRIDYRYTEPAIDNESSDAGVLQAATPLLQ